MTTSPSARLDELSLGFRDRFLSYEELSQQVRAWAGAFPDVCRLTSIGRTPEGRELWLLTLGPDPDRARPSAWVDGNMHASELCGSSVALAIAEDILRLHLRRDGGKVRRSSAAVEARLRDVRFYVLPRMSPDGAEAVMPTGRYVRSIPRDDRPAQAHAHWRGEDVDGDGLALSMRVRDPGGEMVESPEFPGLAAAAWNRRRAAVLQGLSGRRHRELRRQERAVTVFPLRQPDRPQPQLSRTSGRPTASRRARARFR